MAKLAFLGLGVMGGPMAGHLQKAGHEVTVYNRTASKAEDWVREPRRRAAADPARGREGRRFRDGLRRQRRRPARRSAWATTAPSRAWRRRRLRRSHHGVGRGHARAVRGGGRGRDQLCRRADLGRAGGGRERPAVDHVRRRPGCLRPRAAGDGGLRQDLPPDRRQRRGPDDQDVQPDRHRGPGAGPVARRCISPRRRASTGARWSR